MKIWEKFFKQPENIPSTAEQLEQLYNQRKILEEEIAGLEKWIQAGERHPNDAALIDAKKATIEEIDKKIEQLGGDVEKSAA